MPNSGMLEMSMEERLNLKVAPILKRLEHKLNINTRPYGDLQPGNLYHLPQIVGVGGGVTRFPSGEDAFNLVAAVAGNIIDRTIREEDKTKLVIRRIYGYTAVSRLVLMDDDKEIERILFPFLQEMILTLENEIGFKYNVPHYGVTYASFKRVGMLDEVYFKENENYAGFEIRLYSNTYPMIVLHPTETRQSVAPTFNIAEWSANVRGSEQS